MLTTKQAADRLGIKRQSVSIFIKRGYIRAEKYGRDYLIEESEIERYGRERLPRNRPSRPEQVQARFWSKVDKSGECWEWISTINQDSGYGMFWLNGKYELAHRVSYTWSHGQIPRGLYILHRCDNRRCVRPDHLFAGTQADNGADMVAKGRSARGRNHSAYTSKRLKLTDEQVAAVIARYRAGGATQKQVAAEFGISPSLVGFYVNGKRRHF